MNDCRSHLRAPSLSLSFLPEKLDYDDGRVEEVDCVLEEDEAVQVRLVGPAVRQEVPDDPQPDVGAEGEEESWAWKLVNGLLFCNITGVLGNLSPHVAWCNNDATNGKIGKTATNRRWLRVPTSPPPALPPRPTQLPHRPRPAQRWYNSTPWSSLVNVSGKW